MASLPSDEPLNTLCTLSWEGDLADLAAGKAKGLLPDAFGKDRLFVARCPETQTLFAYRNDCPHQPDTGLAWQKDRYLNRRGDLIVCSAHGALFNLQTGQCLRGPCLGDSLQALPVKRTEDGLYRIDVLEQPNR